MHLRFRGFRTWSCLIQSALSVIFLIFGIDLLLAAYALTSPQYFVLTFFASNLIILISAVVLIGGIVRWFRGEPEEEAAPPLEAPVEDGDATKNGSDDCRVGDDQSRGENL
ncbi:MAG: hypothetical protein HY788_19835 [Deltaproteobacteria bacterium]|nr:hypothetical protein [Deltaproteobacteria bacterium]